MFNLCFISSYIRADTLALAAHTHSQIHWNNLLSNRLRSFTLFPSHTSSWGSPLDGLGLTSIGLPSMDRLYHWFPTSQNSTSFIAFNPRHRRLHALPLRYLMCSVTCSPCYQHLFQRPPLPSSCVTPSLTPVTQHHSSTWLKKPAPMTATAVFISYPLH